MSSPCLRSSVFGTQVKNVSARASRQTAEAAFTSTDEGDSVGEGVLKRFNIIYDYRHQRMIAWPSQYRSLPDVFIPPGS